MNIADVLNAFRSDGFAEIELHDDTAERLLKLAKWFYTKSLNERLAVAAFKTNGVLGYYPSEMEATDILKQHGQNVPVFKGKRVRGYCSYDYIANEKILADSDLLRANLWPIDEKFQAEASNLYKLVSQFTKTISKAILNCLESIGRLKGFPRNAFDQECCSIMRLLKYSKCQTENISKEHTDYEFISLICADAQGLEVQSSNGQWKMTPCNDGKVVIMPGDMLEVASNGWVQSAPHRVHFGLEDRLAVIFFQGLGLQQEIVYSNLEKLVASTFEKHLCGMLIRGAPHLECELKSWEKKLGLTIPDKNPFQRAK